MKKKISIKQNALMGGINKFVSLIFPLISFTYVSRILGVENYGKYNFSQSIFSYFALIAELGISTYAIREGVKYRDDREKMSEFASEIFTINLLMTLISYIALGALLFLSRGLFAYRACIGICSIAMIFTVIGVEWLFSVYEEYTYITIRNIIFKLVSLGLMFILVKNREDYLWYAGICVFASSGSCILNFIKAYSYCDIHISIGKQLKKHTRLIFVFAAINIAVYIYNSSDITMLGMFADDIAVGLYSAASKMYKLAKSTLLAMLTVTIPRLSLYVNENDKKKFKDLLNKVINYMNLLMIPLIMLIIIEGKDILTIIAGEEYLDAYITLVVLAIAIVCSMYAWISSQCVLVPNGKESENLYSTLIGAIINIILNIGLIPRFGSEAAACTTVVAELFVAIYCTVKAKKYIKYKFINRNTDFILLGAAIMFGSGYFIKKLISHLYLRFFLVSIITAIIYVAIVLLAQNEYAYEIINILKKQIGNKK